jgi:hypothetical protein
MKKFSTLTMLFLGLSGAFAFAEETNLEKAETVKNNAVNSIKKTARDVKDKTCEMINGKMECVVKQVKHTGQDAMDATKTKVKEIENKVDKK